MKQVVTSADFWLHSSSWSMAKSQAADGDAIHRKQSLLRTLEPACHGSDGGSRLNQLCLRSNTSKKQHSQCSSNSWTAWLRNCCRVNDCRSDGRLARQLHLQPGWPRPAVEVLVPTGCNELDSTAWGITQCDPIRGPNSHHGKTKQLLKSLKAFRYHSNF